jgi:sigma-B regulation protein RsbU (phosphoserine phosphatase)
MSTQRSPAQLQRLLDVTTQMAASTDLDALLATIVTAACDVLSCERATIFLYDAGPRELYSRVATGADEIRFPASKGIAGAAATRRAVINVPDAYADERFNQEIDRETGFRTRSLLTFPLENLEGELMGVLQALNHHDGPFTAEDEALAEVLSAQAGVTLHREFLLEAEATKRRMERELEIARGIQMTLLPKQAPQIGGYEVTGWNRSADQTGGDCFDFIRLGEGRLGILLADATGHGIAAALVIAQCRSLVRGFLSHSRDLATAATCINAVLSHDLDDDRFVTAFIGILDAGTHTLEYIAAGQGPLLWLSDGGVESLCATGLPLGVLDDTEWETERFSFRPGSLLALLTDGFFEAEAPDGDDYFGEPRVVALLGQHGGQRLDGVVTGLHAEIDRFTQGTPQADDLTAVLVRRDAAE